VAEGGGDGEGEGDDGEVWDEGGRMKYYAHTTKSLDKSDWQEMEE
jgi:hypothetical protein